MAAAVMAVVVVVEGGRVSSNPKAKSEPKTGKSPPDVGGTDIAEADARLSSWRWRRESLGKGRS